jgi:hypothetical protein
LVPLTPEPEAAVPNPRSSGRSPPAAPEPHSHGANAATETPPRQRLRRAARIATGRKRGRPRKPLAVAAAAPPPKQREPQAEPIMMRQHLVAKRYGISEGTVKKWTATGEVESRKIGRMRLVLVGSLRRRLGLDE